MTTLKEVKKRSAVIAELFNLGDEWLKKEEENFSIGPAYIGLDIPSKLNLNRIEALYMSEEELQEYFENLRLFLLNEYEKESVPIGGQTINLDKLHYGFQNLIKLDVFNPKVFYEEDGKKFLKGYDNYGLKINCWFPEMKDVKIAGQYSIVDQLRDKDLFFKKAHRIIIKNRPKVYERRDEYIFPKLSHAFNIVAGAQSVTNIRPSVAKWVWLNSALNNCKDQDEIIVWDPSMGWAGRMIAFLSAMADLKLKDKSKFLYIGTDPNEQIFDRYEKIITFWKKRIDFPVFENSAVLGVDPKFYSVKLGSKAEIHPLCMGSEDFNKTDLFKKFRGRGSIVYTSPPYFAKEQYSKDEGQSFKKFPAYQGWKKGFLKPTIENAYEFLAEGKLFYWNIADVNIGGERLPLEQDSIKIAEKAGFTHKETLYQLMKNFPGRDKSNQQIKKQVENGANFIETEGKWVKYEPVFVFEKRANKYKTKSSFSIQKQTDGSIKSKLLQDTPVEKYENYYVKREDLACLPPGPPFAKVRGLFKGLQEIKSRGINTVGYFETSISMATWGVTYFCQLLGIKPVVFYYRYKSGLKYNQRKQLKIWEKYNAEVHRLEKANMQKVQESVSKKKFIRMYPEGEFLPAGLKFDNTVEEVAKQVKSLPKEYLGGTIVICTGSGMMAAGVLRGLYDLNISQDVIGVVVHPKSTKKMKEFVIKKSGLDSRNKINFNVVDYGYEYTQKEECYVPFPCCPYYDRKAYKYMVDNLDNLKKPVLFWNIGSSY